MIMKIQEIFIKNFAGVGEFTCSLSPGVNYITGSNGSGKTTAGVTAIWACLKGVGERGDVLKGKRFRFVGVNDSQANLSVTLSDERGTYVVSREFSDKSQQLKIESSDGRQLDQDWINSFFNEFLISPLAFAQLDGREQAAMMGIDTSEFDDKIEELKEEAKMVRREVKNFGEVVLPEIKPEPVDVSGLLEEKNRIAAFNKEQDDLMAERRRLHELLEQKKSRMGELQRELSKLRSEIDDLVLPKIEATPVPQEKIDSSLIDEKISHASQANAAVVEYESIERKIVEKEAKEMWLSDILEQIKSEYSRKVDYMNKLDLPFSTLTIDDNGGLLMEGKPISKPYLSAGELIKVCTLLMASRMPEWKYVYLEDFDLLDDKKAEEVLSFLSENGFQVVAERVSRQQTNGVAILSDI